MDSSFSVTQNSNSSMKNKINGCVMNNEMAKTVGLTDNEISHKIYSLFENNTKAIIWGQQTRAIQVFLIILFKFFFSGNDGF
jgi:hypothetical protein